MIKNIFLLGLVIVFLSCGPDKYMKNSSGIVVEYIEHGEGSPVKDDSILILYMKQRNIKDKVIHHSYPMKPMALRFNAKDSAGHLWEVISKMKVGDSVYFNTTAQNLYEETYRTKIPQIFIPQNTIKINIRLANQLTEEGYEEFDREMMRKIDSANAFEESMLLEKYLKSDGDSIDQYLTTEGINAITTASGLRYVINEQGTGENIEPGDEITVNYTGSLFMGDTFDSSYDKNEPYTLTIGRGSVIAGWDEGFTYLNKGSKATFYIPSPLAYGEKRPNPNIPPYAIMVFDVEVVDVKKK